MDRTVRLDRLVRSKSLRAEGASLRDLDFILRPLKVFCGSERGACMLGRGFWLQCGESRGEMLGRQ